MLPVLLSLLISLPYCTAQTCPALSGMCVLAINSLASVMIVIISPSGDLYSGYRLNRPFTEGNSFGTSCMETFNDPSEVGCLPGPPRPPLIDGDLGPEGTDYTSSMVHTWHRSAQTVTITYTLTEDTAIRHMNLYFYNIPSMSIGLPSVTVLRSDGNSYTPVQYYITGNGNITQQDSMRRNVLLSLTSALEERSYMIQFDFENTESDVEWLVLSETQLCPFPEVTAPSTPPSLLFDTAFMTLSADNLSPNLTLSCTVMGEGRFSWQWTGPDGNPPSAVILSDVTRTSTAVFTNIRNTLMDTLAEETGERSVSFRCEATYRPVVPGIENSAAQDITISLQGTPLASWQ